MRNKPVVDEIATLLQPWQSLVHSDTGEPLTDGEIRERVAQSVNYAIQRLERLIAKHFSRAAVTDHREHSRALKLTIEKLKRQISNAPIELKMRLKIDGGVSQPRMANFLSDLDYIKSECEIAIKQALTAGRQDQVKQWCARVAHSLIWQHSTKRPTSGSINSKFRRIAGELYKAVNEKAAPRPEMPDLRRACEEVLRTYKSAQIAP